MVQFLSKTWKARSDRHRGDQFSVPPITRRHSPRGIVICQSPPGTTDSYKSGERKSKKSRNYVTITPTRNSTLQTSIPLDISAGYLTSNFFNWTVPFLFLSKQLFPRRLIILGLGKFFCRTNSDWSERYLKKKCVCPFLFYFLLLFLFFFSSPPFFLA